MFHHEMHRLIVAERGLLIVAQQKLGKTASGERSHKESWHEPGLRAHHSADFEQVAQCPQSEVLRHVHGRTKPRASPESRQHL